MKRVAMGIGIVLGSVAAVGQAQTKPELAAVSFLIGDWVSGRGDVADTGQQSTGSSHIQLVANGGALLRQDRTNLFDKNGRAAGGLDQVMLVYPEGGTLRADYSDGQHVIHYTSAAVEAGKSVTFSTSPSAAAPMFKLNYTLDDPNTLAVTFSMAPPGSSTFRNIATGTLKKGS